MLMSAAPAHAAGSGGSEASSPLRLLASPGGALTALGATVRAPAAAIADTYEVQAGDSVSTIAARHGLRTADVLAVNGLTWSSIIQPGQILLLAGSASVEPAPPAAAPPAETAGTGSYVVAAGDTISSIAAQHGVSVDAVLAANGMSWSSIIYPGESIAVPGASAAAASAPAVPVSQADPVAPPAAAAAGTYAVAAGDTLSAIAQLHGRSTQILLDANALDRSSIIHPGQILAIPSAASLALVADTAPAQAPTPSSPLDAEQAANADIIISVGRELGVSDRGIAIALGTAMQESWLRNLDWGDRDSLGLFQQRPSTGWGSPDQVRDPVRAARTFYGGPADPNGYTTRGLLDIDGWTDLSFADAAQAVQISAFPERYAQWEQPAYAWLAAHG